MLALLTTLVLGMRRGLVLRSEPVPDLPIPLTTPWGCYSLLHCGPRELGLRWRSLRRASTVTNSVM